MKLQLKTPLLFIPVFIYFFIFRYFLILGGDDFFWWGEHGQYLLTHNFVAPNLPIYGGSGNGRYLGNLLEIFTTRHLLLAMLVYASCCTMLLLLIYKLGDCTLISFIGGILGTTLLPTGLFTDVLAWNAGFVNYVPPMITILWLLYLNYQPHHDNFLLCWLTLLIMLVGQLFLESMTLLQLFFIIVIIGWQKFQQKHVYRFNIYGLAGALIGAAIMAAHPSYYLHTNNYRQLVTSFNQIIHNYIYQTHFYFLTFNIGLNLVLALLVLGLLWHSTNLMVRVVISGLTVIFIGYLIYISNYIQQRINDIFIIQNLPRQIAIIDSIVMTGFWLLILIIALLFLPNSYRYKIITFQLAGFLSIAPFFIINNPLRIREYFCNYIFMLLTAITLANYLISTYLSSQRIFSKPRYQCIILLITAALALHTLTIMSTNHYVNEIRTSNSAWLSGQQSQLRQHVPFRNYVKGFDRLIDQHPQYYRFRQQFNFIEKFWR
ncbi:hypothetical protein [Bombilactobacillus bombi]|uniref:hypothetical protein n=1 Tax=Bombilactobacillus bombi TaxID=1303590 RepID=UPI0015E5AD66|nr:hypothetical protein [Bombilactobacillus bombi]MBA1434287.1 hypothetical protein [Bombilactobacillus bombi]